MNQTPIRLRRIMRTSLVAFSLIILSALGLLAAPSLPAQAACGTSLATSKGLITMTVNAPSAGTYRVWVRMLAPSAGVDGFYLQIPDASVCNVTMANGGVTVNSWTWVDYQNASTTSKVNATLTAGNHQVQIAGLDDGVLVDKILLLSDATCVPTGDGSNCTAAAATATPTPAAGGASPTATPTAIAVPTSSGTGANPVTVKNTVTIPVPADLSNAKCAVDGKSVDCNLVDTKKLSDGEHVVTVTGTDKDGKPVVRSTTIKVQNSLTLAERLVAGLRQYRLPLIVLGVVIVAVPVAWFLNHRFGLLNSLRLRLGMSSSHAAAPTPDAPGAPPAPAPQSPASSNLVYPSDPSDPNKPNL